MVITLKLNDWLLELKEKHYNFVDEHNTITINNSSFPCNIKNEQLLVDKNICIGSKLIIDIPNYIYDSGIISFLLQHHNLLIKINNKNYRFYTNITTYHNCRLDEKEESVYVKVSFIEL